MGKSKKEKRQAYFFDNKTLLALILPLVVEQLLAVLVGMADSIMIASVGEAAVSGVSLVDQIMVLLTYPIQIVLKLRAFSDKLII